MDEESGYPILDGIVNRNITADEFLDKYFDPLCDLSPDKPPFQILQDLQGILNWNKELCVTGLVEEEYLYVLDLYETCKMYKALPKQGGVEDQSPKLMEMFKVLEAETIRFEKIRMESKDKK